MNFLNALAPIGSLISGIGNAVGSAVQYNTQKKLLEQQYKNQIDFWNMNNEYNTPKNQLARLQDAGINPYSQYGGNNTSSYGSVMQQTPQVPNYVSAGVSSMMSILRTMAEIKNINAQAKNFDSQASRAEHQNALDDSQTELNHIISRMKDKEYKAQDQEIYLRQQLAGSQIRLFDAQYQATIADANLKTSMYNLNIYDYNNIKPLQVSLLKGQVSQLEDLRKQIQTNTRLSEQQINLVMAQVALTLQQKDYVFAQQQKVNQDISINRPTQILAQSYSNVLNTRSSLGPTNADWIATHNYNSNLQSSRMQYDLNIFNFNNARFKSLSQEEQYNLLMEYGASMMSSQIFNNYMNGISRGVGTLNSFMGGTIPLSRGL